MNQQVSEAAASRFLRMATLGPTWREVQELVALGSKAQWVTDQIASSFDGSENAEWETVDGFLVGKPGWHNHIARRMLPHAKPGQPGQHYANRCYPTSLIYNNPPTGGVFSLTDPAAPKAPGHSLQCRVVWALTKFFPIASVDHRELEWDTAAFQCLLARYAFRTYEELLEAITYSKVMADALTYWLNLKEIDGVLPDENKARELKQLFSVGQFRLDDYGRTVLDEDGAPIDNYSNEDIQEAARILTGFVPPNTSYKRLHEDKITLAAQGLLYRREFDTDRRTYGPRKPLHTIEAGRYYIIRSAPADSTADFTRLGAADPAADQVFLASHDGAPHMTSGLVSEERYAPAGERTWMVQMPSRTDLEAKNVVGIGYSCPAGTDPESQVRGLIRALVRHPSTAPYVCQRLIRCTTTSNPSPAYVKRVVDVFRDNGRNVVGDMAAVWTAILLDPEADSTYKTSRSFGRVRDPLEMYSGLVRSMGATQSLPEMSEGSTGGQNVSWDGERAIGNEQGQVLGLLHNSSANGGGGGLGPNERNAIDAWPGNAPSIFGFYPPEYSQPPVSEWGSLIPESAMLTSARLAAVLNRLEEIISRGPARIRDGTKGHDVSKLTIPSYENALGVADLSDTHETVRRLNVLLCGGNLSPSAVTDIVDTINAIPGSLALRGATDQEQRVAIIIQAMINAPEFFIQ